MFKKTIIFAVAVMLSVTILCPVLYADTLSNAEAAILIETNSNKALYEKNADAVLPMASTTKIMTALTVLQYFEPNAIMTVPAAAVGVEGTSACLREGESYTLKELLYAMLLQSANDAAAAIAINAAGSIDGFAVLMNKKASSMGLTQSHFTNPHGLPHQEHRTTARELALIASEALKNEDIAQIVATKNVRIDSEDGTLRYFTNHNKMLSTYEGADGVKTGFTKASGRCLVSSATRDGLQLVAVTLHSHDDWNEHTRMLDWGFENYEAVAASDVMGLSFVIPVMCVDGSQFICASAKELYITVKRGERGLVHVRNEYPRFLYSPIDHGDVIGKCIYYYNGEAVAHSPITVSYSMDE